jgi:hypothetical protein
MRGRSAKLRDVRRMKTCVHGKVEEMLQGMRAVIAVETRPYELDSQLSDMFFKILRDFEADSWFRDSKFLKPSCDFLIN